MSAVGTGRTMRRLAILPVVAALALSVAACGPGAPSEEGGGGGGEDISSKLRIGVKATDSDAQIYYAKELGYFKDAGLNVEVRQISDGAAIASGVVSKSLEIGSANVTSVATSAAEGLPFVFLAPGSMYDETGPISASLVVPKDSKVKSAADLKGKTVAVNGLKNITDLAVKSWVDKNGGDSKTLKFIEFPFPQMPAALDQGKVDAALILEPALSKAVGNCCRVLGNAYGGISKRFMTSGWVATKEWSEKNPEKAKKFSEVMAKTAAWANKEENHERSAEILVKNLEIEEKTAANMKRAIYGETLEAGLIQPQIDVGVKYDVVTKELDAKDLISTAVTSK